MEHSSAQALITAPEVIGIEGAGVFWLVAELLLFLAIRHLHRQIPNATPPRRTVDRAVLSFVLLLSLAPLRILFWHPTPAYTAAYWYWITTHHIVWATYVGVWILLEALLLWAGIAVYYTIAPNLALSTKGRCDDSS